MNNPQKNGDFAFINHPNFVVGIRQTKIAAVNNKITGYNLIITYSFEKSQFDAIRTEGRKKQALHTFNATLNACKPQSLMPL